jgi:uncharacterized damage-inducible protein DinB
LKSIDLFPYWSDNRALLMEVAASLRDEDLERCPAQGFRSAGEVLRHVITAEERWWHGGIHGRPYDEWRPPGWDRMTPEEIQESRRQRFPTTRAILEGLQATHAPVDAFLKDLDAADLCEKRRATWGDQNTLRWILWHLVEHDQHHRAQLCTRARMLGHAPRQIWPRPDVMGRTPARDWRAGEVAITDIVPFWKQVHATLRRAVSTLTDADLAFAHAPGRPTIHDLVLHIFIWEDFLIRQNLGRQMGTASGSIQGWFWKSDVTQMARNVGPYFPTVGSLLDGMDGVHAATRAFVEELAVAELAKTVETPNGAETVHHVLWYAREHTVHHRAQLFFRMRLAGRTPPEI